MEEYGEMLAKGTEFQTGIYFSDLLYGIVNIIYLKI